VFYSRGKVLGQQKKYAAAIEDFTESLRLDDKLEQNYRTRGMVYQQLGNIENVVRDYSEFIRRKPTNRWILNDLAWIHATCPDPNIRDGAKAVDLAKRACEVSEWKNSAYVDTLAAAYAEMSDWETAISTQDRALKMATSEAEKADYGKRLSLYQKKEPFRVPQRQGE
jgi:serine/threonine-protein kinase